MPPLNPVNTKDLKPLIVSGMSKASLQSFDVVRINHASANTDLPKAVLPPLPENLMALKKSSIQDDKWEMGLIVAPSFGNAQKINIGYGVSMAYVLNNKIALNSGITYAAMNAVKIKGNGPQVAGTRSLQSTDASIKGLDIPLELKYSVSKNVYANMGISALAVLNHKQDNNYVTERIKQVTVVSPLGLTETRSMVIKERSTEKVPEEQLNNDKFIGFYNISVGFKQKISERKALFVEPFLKLPMKDFSKEDINLMDGGIRLRVNF